MSIGTHLLHLQELLALLLARGISHIGVPWCCSGLFRCSYSGAFKINYKRNWTPEPEMEYRHLSLAAPAGDTGQLHLMEEVMVHPPTPRNPTSTIFRSKQKYLGAKLHLKYRREPMGFCSGF